MPESRRAARWLSGDARAHPAWAAALLVLLVGVHELLLAQARPFGRAEGAYLQVLVLAQCALVASTATVVMSLVPARASSWIAGLALAAPALLYADALVLARIDRHLPSVAALLLDAHVDDNRRLLEATGVDLRALAVFVAGLVVAVLAGAWLDRRVGRLGSGRVHATRARLLAIAAASWLATAALELGSQHAVHAATWARFGRSVPQLLGALGPTPHALASVRVALRPLPDAAEADRRIAGLTVPPTPAPGDVFFFVVESLRADALSHAGAPAMTQLADDGLRIDVAVSGGNVTQYGWYALFTSRPALYWHLEPSPEDAEGAIPLRIARKRGWRVEVLTANDLSYMRLAETIFGASRALADEWFDVSGEPGLPAEHDDRVVRELSARAARPHPPTVFVIALDATHLPYTWTPAFVPPFAAYAGPRHYIHVQTEPSERAAVVNRYRDAVAYDDSLVGRFADGLRASGAYDDATIVLAGDHGEEFWEHGLVSHGSEPCGVQTRVPLFIKPSRALRATGDWSSPKPLASGMDVWPTLLDAAGVTGDLAALLVGSSLLRGLVPAAPSADQRYWYRPGRFVVDDGRRKAELEMRHPDDPFREQPMDLLGFRDADDALTDGELTPSAYVSLLRERFGPSLDRFLVVRW
jgi:membrane-anchored protein YejM (alkaline phosphatase superfamily)